MTELTVLTSADRNIKDIVFTDQHLIKLYYTYHIDNPRELQNLGSMIFFDKFQSDQAVSVKYQNILSNKHLAKLISQSSEFIYVPKEQLQSGKNYTLDEAINDAKSYINSLVKTPEFSL